MKQLTDEEYSNMVARIQFLENKSDRLEAEKKQLLTSLKVMIGWSEKSVVPKCGDDFLPRGFDVAKETLEYLSIE